MRSVEATGRATLSWLDTGGGIHILMACMYGKDGGNEKSDARRSIVPFNVLVLGATNRPGDVDEAFVRRMPRSFKVVPPNENARRIILYNILSRELEHDTIKDLNFQEIGKLYQSNFPLENHFHLTSV